MRYKTLLIIFFTITLCACDKPATATKTTTNFNFEKNVGWIHGPCLAIINPDLKAGANVNLILYDKFQIHVKTKIKGKVTSDDMCNALFKGRKNTNQRNGRVFYIIELAEKHIEQMGVAIIGSDKSFHKENGLIQMDLNGDNIDEYSSSCLGSEGINFSLNIKSGNMIKALWEDYYYLDYDITPDCPEQ